MDEEAVRWLREVEEKDPDFFALQPFWMGLELKQGRLDDALSRAEAHLQKAPQDLFTRSMKAVVTLFARDAQAAEAEFGYLYREFPEWGIGTMPVEIRNGLAWALLESGEDERAGELLEEAQLWLDDALSEGMDDTGIPYHLAVVNALSGNREEALAWLRRTFEEGGGGGYRTVAMDPRLDNISSDPRFTALIDEMASHVDSMRARVERGEVDLGIG
jgi:tetratricopeptide (TPR) repeat protein